MWPTISLEEFLANPQLAVRKIASSSEVYLITENGKPILDIRPHNAEPPKITASSATLPHGAAISGYNGAGHDSTYWKPSRYTTISLAEFKQFAPAIYRQAKELGGTLLVMEDQRVRMELKYHDLAPLPSSDERKNSVAYQGDIVSPIEPDGYEPFK
ncbi:MAG: hypothetical protein ABW202_16975 [Duganella sp.]